MKAQICPTLLLTLLPVCLIVFGILLPSQIHTHTLDPLGPPASVELLPQLCTQICLYPIVLSALKLSISIVIIQTQSPFVQLTLICYKVGIVPSILEVSAFKKRSFVCLYCVNVCIHI